MSNNKAIQAIIELMRGEISNIHTCAPGKIISYSGGISTVQPSIKQKITNSDSVDYPVITNVPTYFLGCEGRSITFPVKEGDGCLLFFAERSIDDWLLGGESEDPRKYDLTDCFALVGMQTTRSHANDAIEINHGSCKVRIPENGPVTISTDVIIGGISFLNHIHPESVGSATGKPQ